MRSDKIKTREEIAKIAETLRAEGKTIVTTNGAFDLMHVGHVKSLAEAKKFGDVLIVGLNSGASVKRYKSPKRPIIGEDDRALMLAALELVDYVVIFDEDDPRELLSVIKTDVHCKSKSGYLGIEEEVVKRTGRVELIDDIPGISTSEIIKKIQAL